MPDRTVSPKTHTTLPSPSNVLAPMSAASHAGRSCAARSAFAAFADSTATGLDGADGHEGSSCADVAAAGVGEVEEVGELEDELFSPVDPSVQPAHSTSATASRRTRPSTTSSIVARAQHLHQRRDGRPRSVAHAPAGGAPSSPSGY